VVAAALVDKDAIGLSESPVAMIASHTDSNTQRVRVYRNPVEYITNVQATNRGS